MQPDVQQPLDRAGGAERPAGVSPHPHNDLCVEDPHRAHSRVNTALRHSHVCGGGAPVRVAKSRSHFPNVLDFLRIKGCCEMENEGPSHTTGPFMPGGHTVGKGPTQTQMGH